MNYWIVPLVREQNRKTMIKAISVKRPELIILGICEYYHVSEVDIYKKNRTRQFVLTRFMIFHFLREYTTLSLKQIASLFKQDHTTVIHGISTLKDLAETEEKIKQDMRQINDLLCQSING